MTSSSALLFTKRKKFGGGFQGILDLLSVQPSAAYSLRKLRVGYTGSAIRARRSSDNAEANTGFATAVQTRTNLAAIPINNNGGFAPPGVTMTMIGTGIEFGQPYVEVRWQGTASAGGSNLGFTHSATGAFNSTIHAPVTPGLTYTTSIGFRLVSGTAPSGSVFLRGLQRNNAGNFVSGAGGINLGASLSSDLRRSAVIEAAAATAAFIQPSIYIPINNGEVVDCTIRFYAANVELGTGNARPLLQRNVPEAIAEIGDLDAEALLTHVGSGNGFVTTWYDQSDNGGNPTQATAGNQPRIVSNGAIETQNGKPALRFDGSDFFDNISVSLPQFSVSLVETATQDTAAIYYPVGFGVGGISVGGFALTQKFAINSTTSLVSAESSVLNAPTIVFGGSNNLGRQISVNGNAPATDATAQSISQISIGRRSDAFWPHFGSMSEVIFFPSLLSTTDRQTLESNEGAYYGITVV